MSTGVALGASFPAVGGWVFEISQPPAKDAWRSDAAPTPGYPLQVETIEGQSDGDDLVLGLNIVGDGRKDVMRYVSENGAPPQALIFMSPEPQGSRSINGDSDACAMAREVRENLGQILKARGLRKTRLFFYGPLALSVFLGQQLTSLGEVQLFEYQDPGYIAPPSRLAEALPSGSLAVLPACPGVVFSEPRRIFRAEEEAVGSSPLLRV